MLAMGGDGVHVDEAEIPDVPVGATIVIAKVPAETEHEQPEGYWPAQVLCMHEVAQEIMEGRQAFPERRQVLLRLLAFKGHHELRWVDARDLSAYEADEYVNSADTGAAGMCASGAEAWAAALADVEQAGREVVQVPSLDCRMCRFCLDKVKYGGLSTIRRPCVKTAKSAPSHRRVGGPEDALAGTLPPLEAFDTQFAAAHSINGVPGEIMSRMHPLNVEAYRFTKDALLCPWRCTGCGGTGPDTLFKCTCNSSYQRWAESQAEVLRSFGRCKDARKCFWCFELGPGSAAALGAWSKADRVVHAVPRPAEVQEMPYGAPPAPPITVPKRKTPTEVLAEDALQLLRPAKRRSLSAAALWTPSSLPSTPTAAATDAGAAAAAAMSVATKAASVLTRQQKRTSPSPPLDQDPDMMDDDSAWADAGMADSYKSSVAASDNGIVSEIDPGDAEAAERERQRGEENMAAEDDNEVRETTSDESSAEEGQELVVEVVRRRFGLEVPPTPIPYMPGLVHEDLKLTKDSLRSGGDALQSFVAAMGWTSALQAVRGAKDEGAWNPVEGQAEQQQQQDVPASPLATVLKTASSQQDGTCSTRHLVAQLEMLVGIWAEQHYSGSRAVIKQLRPAEQQAYAFLLRTCQAGVEAALREASTTTQLQEPDRETLRVAYLRARLAMCMEEQRDMNRSEQLRIEGRKKLDALIETCAATVSGVTLSGAAMRNLYQAALNEDRRLGRLRRKQRAVAAEILKIKEKMRPEQEDEDGIVDRAAGYSPSAAPDMAEEDPYDDLAAAEEFEETAEAPFKPTVDAAAGETGFVTGSDPGTAVPTDAAVVAADSQAANTGAASSPMALATNESAAALDAVHAVATTEPDEARNPAAAVMTNGGDAHMDDVKVGESSPDTTAAPVATAGTGVIDVEVMNATGEMISTNGAAADVRPPVEEDGHELRDDSRLFSAAATEWSLVYSTLCSPLDATGSSANGEASVTVLPVKESIGKTRLATRLDSRVWSGDVPAALNMVHTAELLAEVEGDKSQWSAVSGITSIVLQAVDTMLAPSGGPTLCRVPNIFSSAARADGYGPHWGSGARVNLGAAAALYAHLIQQVPRVAIIECGADPPTGTQDILARTLMPQYLLASVHWESDAAPEWGEGRSPLEPTLVSCSLPKIPDGHKVDTTCKELERRLDFFRPSFLIVTMASAPGPVEDQDVLRKLMASLSAAGARHCSRRMMVLLPESAELASTTICTTLKQQQQSNL